MSSNINNTSRTLFRPCIDLHDGQVKQIVGGTLKEQSPSNLKTNFVSSNPSSYYANLYRQHKLLGAHIIKLGPNNDEAAKEALKAWPGKMQIGGGITIDNALKWIENGAEKVIVTSWLFSDAKFDRERLVKLCEKIGRDRLVVDISCRSCDGGWWVAMNKWQTITDMQVTKETLDMLSEYCSEFLIHAADVEGLCQGIDQELVKKLGEWVTIPTTYAGGGRDLSDLELVNTLSNGKVDLTIGSALDIFGGGGVKFLDCVAWNKGSL
ncbi:Enzyme that catalyzes the fourth step in the histidine pathway [Mycoemilia scoparia]|uniref:1-(5-phosphoribosyl)-5-[(5-phosphoribosylamino)methylideneamino] imidazole-4-carboxamide isomerase n=1 Tax=Mycoemilia scoparia TaxID=417184 RepID=A0A9W8DPK7_9FUNG|nr:Enzyme that catalyzes the fourth step in the histidine pathway [Mycoemilia scoparia]